LLLALLAGWFLVMSVKGALDRSESSKKRIGRAAGNVGLAIMFGAVASALALDLGFFPYLFAFFAVGMVVAGVGGSMAGWRNGLPGPPM
jgi:hypothetical protein